MSELQRNEIIYEEGWREAAPAAEAETQPVDEAPPTAETGEENRGASRPLLLTIQLVLCLLAALALFLLKTMDSDIYHAFMGAYHEELNKPIVSQGVFGSLDVGSLFEDDPITIRSTPDEAARR